MDIEKLLENNRSWAEQVQSENPEFFTQSALGQSPKFLWIGCSDSRVPATQVTGVKPGEIFVHRNVANLVVNNDVNLMAALQYSIFALKVEHVIVCGHYGCGGVQASLGDRHEGALEIWINNIRQLSGKNAVLQDALKGNMSEREVFNLACEINVSNQVTNLCENPLVLNAWEQGQKLAVHGWIYSLEDGLLKDLEITRNSPAVE